MRFLLTVFVLLSFCHKSHAQALQDLSFGTPEHFEIMTWNIEWFPKSGQATVDSVARIIEALDVDLIALQEISDTTVFKKMVDSLEDYQSYFKSSWFGGLAYLYKTDSVEFLDAYEIYTSEPYWNAFPRAPLVIELNFRGDYYVLINNHLKCCGDEVLDLGNPWDEENRRLTANNLLKEYVDSNHADQRVIILGDLNDILIDAVANNVFQSFLDDADNYLFADMAIAQGSISDWSYQGWPSHLDHILLTDEIFNAPQYDSALVQTLKIDAFMAGGISSYDAIVSDHRPVALQLYTTEAVPLAAAQSNGMTQLSIHPNPATDKVNVLLDSGFGHGYLDIFNSNGQKIQSLKTIGDQGSIVIELGHSPPGIYYARHSSGGKTHAVGKIILTE